MMSTANVALLTTLVAPTSTSWFISSIVNLRPIIFLLYIWARIPSRMTMEPSTTIPKSIAPRLIRLADTPKILIIIKPNSMASGMTDATMRPARIFPRKIMRTRNTMMAPSIRFFITVEMLRFTSSERLRYGSIFTPSGSIFCTLSIRPCSSLVTTLAFAPLSIMAIPPTHSPSPSLVIAPKRLGAPNLTFPMSEMCTGTPSLLVITVFSISDKSLIIPSERI